MAGLEISGLRTHEMGKLKGDGFVVSCPLGCLQFHAKFIKLDG